MNALLQSTLPYPVHRGKVRDVYDLGDSLLIVSTDRISAFDIVLPVGIPDKGRILTALSLFWFEKFGRQFENHLITGKSKDFPAILHKFHDQLHGRSMLVRKAKALPIQCVARGYLAGSAWKEYQRHHTVSGIHLPSGLKLSDKLPAPIFTPACRRPGGHDVNISYEEMEELVGHAVAVQLRDKTLALYTSAAQYAAGRGVFIADTVFEFGQLPDGRVILIDEVLTPDSSRFWPADDYEIGHEQPSFDKQYVRNYLEAQLWDKKPPAPVLPPEVVMGTRERYFQAYHLLTGKELHIHFDPT